MAQVPINADFRAKLQDWIPRLVLSPSLALVLVFVYGFILFTIYLSFSDSRLLPSYGWVGLDNYSRLFRLSHWEIAITNLGVFASLYIIISCLIGLSLAIFL
ncbi:MAG: glucose/mannose transport system permease protein, partial [Glaciecola sp.]